METADGLYVMVPFTVAGVKGKNAAVTTTQTKKKVYKITAAKKKITIRVKKKKKIKYSITKGYIGLVRLKTSNPRIATINSKGVVTARKKGKCKITLSLSNGKKAVVQITVKK